MGYKLLGPELLTLLPPSAWLLRSEQQNCAAFPFPTTAQGHALIPPCLSFPSCKKAGMRGNGAVPAVPRPWGG